MNKKIQYASDKVKNTYDDKVTAVILKVDPTHPNHDIIATRECYDEDEANMWVDDQLMMLETGKGIYD